MDSLYIVDSTLWSPRTQRVLAPVHEATLGEVTQFDFWTAQTNCTRRQHTARALHTRQLVHQAKWYRAM